MSVNEKMTALADAIREKTGETGPLSLDAMAQKIRQLEAWLINTAVGDTITLSDSLDMKLRGLKLFGRTTQNGPPTPEAPVPLVSAADGGSVDVTVAGKNLLIDDIAGTYVGNGTTYEIVPDMRVAGGFLPNTQYTMTVGYTLKDDIQKSQSGRPIYFKIVYTDGYIDWVGFEEWETSPFIYVSQPGKTLQQIAFTRHLRWTGGTIVINYSQIEMGVTATEYEPYKPVQTLPISTPNGLPGIPVTSGGNYTDENGQQWLCDEVDFTRGVYVQRIFTNVFSDASGWVLSSAASGAKRFGYTAYSSVIKGSSTQGAKANILCSSFPITSAEGTLNKIEGICADTGGIVYVYYGDIEQTLQGWGNYLASNPVTFMAVLATPIETALSAEELAAYAALHTNYPNTTILNDGGAGMEVSYVADTKLYIDNKINAMAAAIVNA